MTLVPPISPVHSHSTTLQPLEACAHGYLKSRISDFKTFEGLLGGRIMGHITMIAADCQSLVQPALNTNNSFLYYLQSRMHHGKQFYQLKQQVQWL
jgi:hypothetical protein